MGVGVGSGVGMGSGVAVGVGVGSGVGDGVGAGVGVGVAVAVGVGSGVGVASGVAVGSSVGVGVGSEVGDGAGAGSGVGVGSGDGLGSGVSVGFGVADGSGVEADVGSVVGVDSDVGAGASVGVGARIVTVAGVDAGAGARVGDGATVVPAAGGAEASPHARHRRPKATMRPAIQKLPTEPCDSRVGARRRPLSCLRTRQLTQPANHPHSGCHGWAKAGVSRHLVARRICTRVSRVDRQARAYASPQKRGIKNASSRVGGESLGIGVSVEPERLVHVAMVVGKSR